MIDVHQEPPGLGPAEHCCFCRRPTRTWAPNDVPCCKQCAKTRHEGDLPTKEQWAAGPLTQKERRADAEAVMRERKRSLVTRMMARHEQVIHPGMPVSDYLKRSVEVMFDFAAEAMLERTKP